MFHYICDLSSFYDFTVVCDTEPEELVNLRNRASDNSQHFDNLILKCFIFLIGLDQEGNGAVGLIASRDRDGLSNGRKANFLENLNSLVDRLLLKDSEANFFLHDVDSNLSIRLSEALSQPLLDFTSAIGAPDPGYLYGEDAGTSCCNYF